MKHKQKKGEWKSKLTHEQLEHCRRTGAKTLKGVRRNVMHQKGMCFPCFECVEIGRLLGIEVELKAFDERVREEAHR